MAKKFVAKKKKRLAFKLKYLVYLFLIYAVYQFTFGVLLNLKLSNNNEDFLLSMMNDSNHHILYEKASKNIISKLTGMMMNFDPNKPISVLENSFQLSKTEEETEEVLKTSSDGDETGIVPTKYVSDPKPVVIHKPKVYIYNTHQLENYSMQNLEAYNITPNVMMASYLLREKLNKANIETLVEESNFTDFMNQNSWTNRNPYQVSRYFLESAIKKHQDMDLVIDLHRDAIKKDASTVIINGKSYAKVLFVVGKENKNYQSNMTLSNDLSNRIKNKYPTLSRGIMTKEGKGVNGVYNQDLSPKAILIECGGYENTIDEVLNTVEALTDVITEYMRDNHEI